MKLYSLCLLAMLVNANSAFALTSTVTFQNGVAGYTGTFDRYIGESLPAGVDGSTVTDFALNGRNGAGRDTQALIRFDNLFGNSTGQIPAGARILDAELQLATFGGANANATDGPYGVAALTADFNSSTIYTNYSSTDPNGRGAWYEDGHSTRPVAAIGNVFAGEVNASNITSVVQQWSDNPGANHGLVVEAGFPGLNDDLRIFTTGNSLPQARPKLSITYTTDPVSVATFQSGVNGYLSVTSAVLTGPTSGGSGESTSNGVTQSTASLQQGDTSSAERFALIKFGNVFGPGASQAPADKAIQKAWLVLTTTNTSTARSPGPVDAYTMRRDWTTSSLRSQFGATAGLQFSDGDISGVYGRAAGMISGSEVWLDVTDYLEGVRTGTPDYGLAALSRVSDGWISAFNGASALATRPRLVVASQLNSASPGGDFNGDGRVDAADYVAWRKGTVPTTPQNYALWRASFGNTGAGSPGAGPQTILNYDLSVAGQTQGATGALATQSASGVTGFNLNRGPGLIPPADPLPALANGFVANNWTNKSADGGTIDRNRAIAMGDYFQFGFSLDASHTAALAGLDLALRRSATNAPSHFEVQVSLDGFATAGATVSSFNYLGRTNGTPPDVNPALSNSYIYMTTDTAGRPDADFSSGDSIPTIDLTSIAALQILAANSSVTFRLYGWNDGTSGSANSNTVGFRVNGPKLTGFVNAAPGFGQLANIPEPNTLALVVFAGLRFVFLGGRASRRALPLIPILVRSIS